MDPIASQIPVSPTTKDTPLASLDNQLLKIFNQALTEQPSASYTSSSVSTEHSNIKGTFDSYSGLNFDPTLRGKQEFTINADQAPALGDAILQGIKKASTQYQDAMGAVQKNIASLASNPKSIAPENLLQLQLNLMQLDSQINIASKIANKVSQGIQTLFKNQ